MENISIAYPEDMSQEEAHAYVQDILDKHPQKNIKSIELIYDGEFINAKWSTYPMDFERVRRITGYLVGTLDRFNNAKKSEEQERVKQEF